MLATLIETYPRQLEAIGKAWLAAGSASLALWSGEEMLVCWPAHDGAGVPDLCVPIRSGGGELLGELRLRGAIEGAQVRLEADAAIIAAMAEAADELDEMAAALGETEDQLIALYELTQSGSSRLDIGQLLRSITRHAARMVKAEAAFAILAPDFVVQMPVSAAPNEALIALFHRLQTDGHDLLLSAGEASLEWSARASNLFVTPLLLRKSGELEACLGLWFGRDAATLSPDLKLARSVAEQGGAQLEIALLHQELVAQARLQAELELARQVQMGLLPRRPPRTTGLDVFAESSPALRVGGDFFDFYVGRAEAGQDLPLTFTVGDVSGKGMPAALLMAMLRTALRVVTSGMAPERSPEEILNRANSDLYDDFSEVGMMASVFLGRYFPARREIMYANAGHSPVLLCPMQGAVRLLEADGPMLGVLPTSLSMNQVISFGTDDVLVILTDGFNEARDVDGVFFGIERLGDLVRDLAARPAQEIGRQLLAAVRQHVGGQPQDDDQTLIVVKGI